MSEAVNSTNNNPSLINDIKTSVAFSGAITGTGALGTVKNMGLKGAVDSLELKKFKDLNLALKETPAKDIFSRSAVLSESYDKYKNALKQSTKLSKKAAKALEKGDVSLFQKILNLFSNEKTTVETLEESAGKAAEKLKEAKSLLNEGKTITEEAGKIVASTAPTSAKESVKKIFKSEIGNKFVLFFTLMGAIPRVIEEVIPTFKEKGFKEGVKATKNVIARTAVDFVSNAGFSAIGRTIGMAVGSIFPGIGNFVGGILGDAVGSTISMRLTNKLFDEDEKNSENVENVENGENGEAEIQDEAELKNKIAELPNTQPVEGLTGNKELDNRIYKAMTI